MQRSHKSWHGAHNAAHPQRDVFTRKMFVPLVGVSVGGKKGMTASWGPTQISCDPNSGRILDTARGILIGLRRCRSATAFDELHGAAQRHRVPVYAMAWALVHLAGEGEETPSFIEAQSAARHEWGELFAGSAV